MCWRADYSAHGIAPQVPDFIINTGDDPAHDVYGLRFHHTPRSSSGGVAATAPAASAMAEHPLALLTAPQRCAPQQMLAAKLGPDECSWAQTHELNLHAISSVTQLQASLSTVSCR